MKETYYINTDLDIVSSEDLTPLTKHLADKVLVLTCERRGDNHWVLRLESAVDDTDRELSCHEHISDLLIHIERLPNDLKTLWDNARSRSFDLGIQGGDIGEYGIQLNNRLVARIAAMNAEIRITVYPVSQHWMSEESL